MKALHLIKTGDGAMWAFRQIEVLVNNGVEVAVALPAANGQMAERYRAIGVKVYDYNFDFPVNRLWYLPRLAKELNQLVASEKPDIIHSHFVGTTYTMRYSLRNHDRTPRIFQVPGPLHLESGPYAWIEQRLADSRDYWIGSCKWTVDKYIQLGIPSDRVYLSYYGTDISIYRRYKRGKLRRELGLDDKVPLIGMVAYMYKPKLYLGHKVGVKGHEYFIKAVSYVQKLLPNVKAVIIGGPWKGAETYELKLKRMATELCGDAIYFTGHRNDVAEIYSDLDVVAHPSLSENLGGAAESLLCQVPTVSTNVGGFPDIVKDGETGWCVPPGDSESLAKALIEAITNRPEAIKRAERGSALARNLLDINKTGKQILDIYKDVLSKSH
jgi:glycosyltransferase involved in cell wall biosynthesis